ncbi:MAG: hypothetical protein LAT54_10555 [Cryomorphaceae bacterium]|nr:hypothetical protein [Cryomorphaceae bacterium]
MIIFFKTYLSSFLFCWNSFLLQKQPLEQRISEDICECFEAYGFTVLDERVDAALDTCSSKTVKKYQTELEVHFSNLKDSDYSKGYEAGKIYFQQKVAPLLFVNCEAIKALKIPKED